MHSTAVLEKPQLSHRSQTPGREVFAVLEHIPGRIRDIAVLRGLGYSYREIASPLGVTPQAVSLMLMRHRRCLKQLKSNAGLHSLSARAVNVLSRHSVATREAAREKNVLALLQRERNCGAKTISEIQRWMNEGTAAS